MNKDRIEGRWLELKGKVRERWGKLTDDDIDRIAGKRDQLVGKLQERYGWARDQVEREVKQFEDGLEEPARAPQNAQGDRSREERPRRQA
jgi:uncharacterized protein YjbJ (UPF0337 family)